MQRFRDPVCISGSECAEMTFTGGATNHQHTHGQKSWKFFADGIDYASCSTGNSFHQILLHKKEGLNAAHLAGEIAQNQVLIFKIVRQCFLDDFVEAMVLAAVAKGVGPVFVLLKIVWRD